MAHKCASCGTDVDVAKCKSCGGSMACSGEKCACESCKREVNDAEIMCDACLAKSKEQA